MSTDQSTQANQADQSGQAGTTLITQNAIEQFLYREARLLDDREFEKWLECYADDCEYWMPAWDDDDRLSEDPQTEISLIYYANKGGLEDRVFRIRTERSSATSIPEPRTSHNISNVEVIERRGDIVDIRFNWHTMYFRYKTIDPYYGTSFYTVDFSGVAAGGQPLIRRKTVVLMCPDLPMSVPWPPTTARPDRAGWYPPAQPRAPGDRRGAATTADPHRRSSVVRCGLIRP